jgi:hypothetical protein
MSVDHDRDHDLDLVETLTTTLATKATQVEVVVGEFDPTRAGAPPAPVALDRRRRRTRVPSLAAVAALLVAVALVGSAVALSGRGDDPAADTSTAAQGDEPWLVPTWAPEGLPLWSVGREVVAPEDESDGGGPGIRQLFGDPDAGRALYVHVIPQPEEPYDGTAEPTQVRGLPGWYATGGELPAGASWVMWRELGAEALVQFRGMGRDEAVAAIGRLEWRSDVPLEGFAPPDDPALRLRGETGPRRPSQTVQLVYGDGSSGDGGAISVFTDTNGGNPVHYLDAWFAEGGGGDVVVDPDGARHSFEAEDDMLTVTWPDGRYARVSPLDPDAPATVDRAVLARIARSVGPVDGSELDGLRYEADANVAVTPVVASADTSIGSLEVHGSGATRRLCLRRPDAVLDCGAGPTWALPAPDLGSTSMAAPTGWVVDGTWYVAVASYGFDAEIRDGAGAEGDPLPTTDARVDGWLLRLAAVPDGIDEVGVTSPMALTDEGPSPYTSFTRPS